MPAWCSSRTSSPGSRSGRIGAPPPRRNACAPAASITTSTMSATPRGITPSSRCSAISRSAIISRTTPSNSPGISSPKSSGCPKDKLTATVYIDDDEAFDALEEDRGPAGIPHHPHRRVGQFLADGRHRPVRAVLGNLLRPRRQDLGRTAGFAGAGRRPLHRDLESRLHAVRADRPGQRNHRVAEAVDRYRRRDWSVSPRCCRASTTITTSTCSSR